MAYWFLRKYDIFQINSANLVNVRGAQTFNENPLARQSAGAVEVRETPCTMLRHQSLPSSAALSGTCTEVLGLRMRGMGAEGRGRSQCNASDHRRCLCVVLCAGQAG